jgi:hypothetical protein
MKNLTLFSILLVVAIMSVSALFAATPQPTVGPKMLLEGGDCLWDEILAWQRLRAEKKVVVEGDDSAPVVCAAPAGRVYLATGSGKLLTSDDDGQNFGPPLRLQ